MNCFTDCTGAQVQTKDLAWGFPLLYQPIQIIDFSAWRTDCYMPVCPLQIKKQTIFAPVKNQPFAAEDNA